MRIVLAVIVFATIMVAPASADEVRILSSRGGEVGHFIEMFEDLRKSDARIVIDGPCLSACTLVSSIVPSSRICVTHRAILGFHAARSIDRRGRLYAEPKATDRMTEFYPAPVRNWIHRHGGLTSRLLVLRGHELTMFYPPCR